MSVGVGLFGKLPAHGDFVARGDAALVAWFEGWLTQGLGRMAQDHASLDAVLARAAVWRFAVRREGAVIAGALFPSRDGVGRLFPLLVFAESDEASALAHADAIAAMPLHTGTTADEAMAGITDTRLGDPVEDAAWPGADVWRSDTGDVLAFAALPEGEDFAWLFAPVEAVA